MGNASERERSRFVILLIVWCCGLLWGSSPLAAQQTVQAWTRWETGPTQLVAAKTYANPYKNVVLQVTWTCVSDCSAGHWAAQLPRYGFWDGGSTFKIRAAFPQPLTGGTAMWHWATTCTLPAGSTDADCSTDAGLSPRSGDVTVLRSDAAHGITNPLYTGGAFGIAEGNASENGQLVRGNMYLYNDNGPFYWQGDTAWNAPIRARFNRASVPNCTLATGWSTNDWKCYVQDRVNKQYTAVQISVPQSGMANPLTDTSGQPPFIGSNSWDSWNPAFWQGFDEKVQWANEQGLVVLLVGLMEPSYSATSPRYPPQADAVIFARNLTARLSGNFVVFSPGFDTKPDGGTLSNLIRAVGAQIHAVSPRPIITNHFGGSTETVQAGVFNDYADFNAEPWLDNYMFQSGQAKGQRSNAFAQLQTVTQRARQMPLDLRALPVRMGTANIESIYDNENVPLMAGQLEPGWAANYKPYRVRHTAYLSTLSGAFGYSLGVVGIYDWGLGGGMPYQPRAPKDSVGSASASQIQILGNLFRAHRWEWLAPATTLVRNNPPELNNQHLQMVVSRDLTRRSTLAYLPDNAAIQLQLTTTLYPGITTTRWTKQWFNPRTAARQGATAVLVGGTTDVYSFSRPACGAGCNGQNGDADWVLELIDTTLGPRFAAGGPTLQASANWDPATDTWSISGQLVDAQGAPAGKAIAISDATSSLQRLPLVAQTAGGTFVVAWEAEGLDGDRTGIFARQVGAKGELPGKVLQVNGTAAGRQFEPVLTADAAGGIVVAWTDSDPSAGAVRIVGRRLSASLEPLGSEIVVTSGKSATPRAPLIASDAAGNFVIAWQEDEAGAGVRRIVTRRFDVRGNSLAREQQIESSPDNELALERLDVDDSGSFTVVWQRLLDGKSLGHYTRSFDGRNRPHGPARLAASGDE
jgi:hypothetical protein